ncbi:MAG: 4Fe-4S binding protein [Methanoregulaceae archaeon]|jgi:epoxyqueuosine reductase QueG
MNRDIREDIVAWCAGMGIPIVGIAGVKRWEDPPFLPWMPEEFFPHSILPGAQSVIVIGLPIHLPVLETSPSIYYRELYRTTNALLDQYTYRIAESLNARGYPSIFVPRDGYGSIEVLLENPVAFFSHRHAAYCAGLGTFGINNMILTPGYGPRVRFGSVITTAALPVDPVMEENLCIRCMRCVRMCPVSAIPVEDYPEGRTDKHGCATWSAALNRRYLSPCGICIKVCPVGADRILFDRTDASVYEKREKAEGLHRIWEHVRRYGGRKPASTPPGDRSTDTLAERG